MMIFRNSKRFRFYQPKIRHFCHFLFFFFSFFFLLFCLLSKFIIHFVHYGLVVLCFPSCFTHFVCYSADMIQVIAKNQAPNWNKDTTIQIVCCRRREQANGWEKHNKKPIPYSTISKNTCAKFINFQIFHSFFIRFSTFLFILFHSVRIRISTTAVSLVVVFPFTFTPIHHSFEKCICVETENHRYGNVLECIRIGWRTEM